MQLDEWGQAVSPKIYEAINTIADCKENRKELKYFNKMEFSCC
jgi:hypothetical protein